MDPQARPKACCVLVRPRRAWVHEHPYSPGTHGYTYGILIAGLSRPKLNPTGTYLQNIQFGSARMWYDSFHVDCIWVGFTYMQLRSDLLSQYSAWSTQVAPLEMLIGVTFSAVGKHNVRNWDPPRVLTHGDSEWINHSYYRAKPDRIWTQTQSPPHHHGAGLSHGDMVGCNRPTSQRTISTGERIRTQITKWSDVDFPCCHLYFSK